MAINDVATPSFRELPLPGHPGSAAVRVGAVPHRLTRSSGAVLLVLGIAGAALTLYLGLESPILVTRNAVAGVRAGIVALYVLAGLYVWRRRPSEPFGPIIVLLGLTFVLTDPIGAADPTAYAVGRLLNAAWVGLWLFAFLAYPSGRLGTRVDRAIVGFYAVTALVLWPLVLLFAHAPSRRCLHGLRRPVPGQRAPGRSLAERARAHGIGARDCDPDDRRPGGGGISWGADAVDRRRRATDRRPRARGDDARHPRLPRQRRASDDRVRPRHSPAGLRRGRPLRPDRVRGRTVARRAVRVQIALARPRIVRLRAILDRQRRGALPPRTRRCLAEAGGRRDHHGRRSTTSRASRSRHRS